MPQSGSEPRFGPELLRTGPKSGPKSSMGPEPNLKSGSQFGSVPRSGEPRSDRTEPEPDALLALSAGRTLMQSCHLTISHSHTVVHPHTGVTLCLSPRAVSLSYIHPCTVCGLHFQ